MLSGSLLTTLRADISFSSSEESVLELELELELESELELDLALDELESDSVSEPELSSLSLSPLRGSLDLAIGTLAPNDGLPTE